MRQYKAVDRLFYRWFGCGIEYLEITLTFNKLVGLRHYWAEWSHGGHISAFILWCVKSDKYLKPRELAELINLFTDIIGYDSPDEVDEHAPYRQSNICSIRRAGEGSYNDLEEYYLDAVRRYSLNGVQSNKPQGNADSEEPRRLSPAEIRRARTRALRSH